MSRFRSPLRRLAFCAVVSLTCAAAWIASWEVAQSLFAFSVLRQGITLVYVPAGVRLVILLISGAWGALGIALAFPLALVQVFPDVSMAEALCYSLIAGFVPYATLLAICRAARISNDLGTLRAIHLPLMAGAVSVTSALSYTLALVAFGRFDRADFLEDATAMAAGDFLGCFVVVVLVRVAVNWRRKGR